MSSATLKKMGVIVGVRNAILALMTDDSATGTTYAALLRRVPGLVELALTFSVTEETLGADDVTIWEIIRLLDSLEVTITTASLGTDGESFILGHQVDNNGVMGVGQNDKAPYLALGFESTRSDGSVDYIWLTKGMFKPSDLTFRTKEKGKVNWQTPKLTGTFIPRISDGKLMFKVNDQDPGVDQAVLESFFDAPYMPGTITYDVDTTAISAVHAVAALPATNVDTFAVYVLTAADGMKEAGTMWRKLNGTWEEYGAA